MAETTALGTIIGQDYGNTSLGDYTLNEACYAGYNGEQYLGYVMRFTAPEFQGVSRSLTVSLWMYKGVGDKSTLRYALCASDENAGSYIGTTAEVADDNQLAAGTVTFEGLTDNTVQKSFIIESEKIKPGTVYYLFLWASEKSGVTIQPVSSAWGDHSVSLAYISGIAVIRGGGSEVAGITEIYVEGAWVTPVMEIYSSGQWVTPG